MLFSRDTTPEARRILIQILRRKSPAEKLAMVDDAFQSAREFTMTGLRLRHPGAGPSELEALYLQHLLGPETANKVLAAVRSREGRPSAPERDAQRAG